MAATNYQLTEEQLCCCICLEVFTDPVTLPCGHNFCKECITQHLNFNSQRQCPMCKKRVDKKCKLGVNTFISEMTVKFRESAGIKARNNPKQQDVIPEEVSSDVSTRSKGIGLKSCLFLALCLACLTIYLANNLILHETISRLRAHQLSNTVENVAISMCPIHGKPLEFYCKNEQMSICRSCADSSHRFHHIVPLKEEYEVKKTELLKTEATFREKILERQQKNQKIERWLRVSKEAADREMAHGVQVFTALMKSLETSQAQLIGMIDAKQKTTETQAKGLTQQLEQEISELTRRRVEVEQLSQSKDYVKFLQNFPSVNAAPLTKDLPEVSICPAFDEGILRTALVTAVDQLIEIVRNEMEKMREDELMSVQQNALDVTLDPDTAHPLFILSDDGKQVHNGGVWNELPDNPKRFDHSLFVLGKQSFPCGRFYYDVQVKGKTNWILGVAKESIKRKEEIQLKPEDGIWALFNRHHGKQYFALDSPAVLLSVKDQAEKLRVLVDYEEGLVSFYNAQSAALLYSFTGCSFTERLYPIFSPGTSKDGRNSAPLIISPVNQYR